MPIKVVQLFHSYPVFFQPYITPLVNALYKQTDLDFKVIHFHGPSEPMAIKAPKYYKRRLNERLQNLYRNYLLPLNYVEHFCLNEEVAILHIMDSFMFPKVLNMLELPAKNRAKVVITMRGDDTYVKPLKYDKWKLFYKTQAHKVDGFIAMSHHQKAQLVALGIDAYKISVIPISFKQSQINNAHTVNKKEIRIASAFRMVWEKNIEGNLRVIKILKEAGYQVQYHLFGSEKLSGELVFLIAKYDISDCVILKGKIPHDELMKGLLESDFYLQLSHSESLGMAVIEAQSLGLPAIISNAGGLPETIDVGQSGYCVDAWNSDEAAKYIIDLWENPSTYASFSKKGIDYSRLNFSKELEVERLSVLYKHLASI